MSPLSYARLLRWPTLRAKLEDLFGIDGRSLVAVRIGLALILLMDLAHRVPWLVTFYSDAGALPRVVVLAAKAAPWRICFHMISGLWQVQAVLFLIEGIAAVALLIGYRTRLASVVVWILVVSLQARNPFVLQANDTLMRIMFFWGMFLPWGAYGSLDRARHPEWRPPRRILSPATVAFLGQVAVMYWAAGMEKKGTTWLNGTAIYNTLQLDSFDTPLGLFMRQFPALLKSLTFAVRWFELLGPFLLFCPVWTGPVRLLGIAGFCLLQIGFGLHLELGLFPWIVSTVMLGFLPTWFWDRVAARPLGALRSAWRPRMLTLRQRLLTTVGEWEGRMGMSASPKHSPARAGFESPRWVHAAILLLALYVLTWNVGQVKKWSPPVPKPIAWIGRLLAVDQGWAMFAPEPAKDDGWFVMPAQLRDGRFVDAFRDGAALRWEKPRLVSRTYRNTFWRVFLRRLNRKPYKTIFPRPLGRYLCRQWNATHPPEQAMGVIEIVFVSEPTLPDNQPTTPERISLGKWTCDILEGGKPETPSRILGAKRSTR